MSRTTFAGAAMRFVELFGRQGESSNIVVAENNCVALAESMTALRSHEDIDSDPMQYQTQVHEAREAFVKNIDKDSEHYLFALRTPIENGVPTFVQTDFGFKIAAIIGVEFAELARRGHMFVSNEYAQVDGASPVAIKYPNAAMFVAPIIPAGVQTTSPPADGIEVDRVR